MALSDSCADFMQAINAAADELALAVHHYSDPNSPIRYGPEIDALRRACVAVADAPYDPEANCRLFRLAESTMRYHDTPPGSTESSQREAELKNWSDFYRTLSRAIALRP